MQFCHSPGLKVAFIIKTRLCNRRNHFVTHLKIFSDETWNVTPFCIEDTRLYIIPTLAHLCFLWTGNICTSIVTLCHTAAVYKGLFGKLKLKSMEKRKTRQNYKFQYKEITVCSLVDQDIVISKKHSHSETIRRKKKKWKVRPMVVWKLHAVVAGLQGGH